MYPASDKDVNRETDEAVYFFTSAYHPLDNFSAHSIEVWGHAFPTVEHAYQWKKFSDADPDVANQIRNANSPEAVKRIAEKNKAPDEWHQAKVAVMEEILRAKAAQHEDVREVLQKTGSKRIVENSPNDSFWGGGSDGKGENHVGHIWMRIRDELQGADLGN